MSEPERPLAECVEDFWFAPEVPDPAEEGVPDDGAVLDALGRPEITVQGRNLADVLAAAYAALRDAGRVV